MRSECISIYCPCGQSVSRYVVSVYVVYMLRMNPHILPHVVRVSHTMPYQSVLSTWSVCLGIYCPCGHSGVSIYYPCGRCVTICHINPCGPHGRHVSVYIAPCGQHVSVHIVPCGQGFSQYAISIHAVYMVSMSRYILPMWS